MKTKLEKVFFILLIFLPYSCSKDKEDEVDTNLTSKIWTLRYVESIDSHSIIYFPNIDKKITVQFTNDKQIFFQGICNFGSGTFDIKNDSIDISPIMTTEKYCNNINWEIMTTVSLQDAETYKFLNKQLNIYSVKNYNLVFE